MFSLNQLYRIRHLKHLSKYYSSTHSINNANKHENEVRVRLEKSNVFVYFFNII